jgi:hypothetical protein
MEVKVIHFVFFGVLALEGTFYALQMAWRAPPTRSPGRQMEKSIHLRIMDEDQTQTLKELRKLTASGTYRSDGIFRVMLDYDLAEMYAVETKQLKRQVRRNMERFPADFMLDLTFEEYEGLRSQVGTLKRGEHSKYAPMVFTEQGVAMLSSVLSSPTAIEVNIQAIFQVLKKLVEEPEEKPRPRVGFRRAGEVD